MLLFFAEPLTHILCALTNDFFPHFKDGKTGDSEEAKSLTQGRIEPRSKLLYSKVSLGWRAAEARWQALLDRTDMQGWGQDEPLLFTSVLPEAAQLCVAGVAQTVAGPQG